MSRFAVSVLALIALASLPGCELFLDARSPSPPGRTARLDEVNGFWGLKGYRIEVSHGAALVIACVGDPCTRASVTSEDPAIAEVRHATLGALEHAWDGTHAAPGAFVVIGKTPGATAIHVVSGKHRRDVPVTVLAPPGPALAGK